MSVLTCVKPGARPGQVILAIDLTVAGDSKAVLDALSVLGYTPTIRHVDYPAGVHVLAILKEEQHTTTVPEDHWLDEWLNLRNHLVPDAVHLWRGHCND